MAPSTALTKIENDIAVRSGYSKTLAMQRGSVSKDDFYQVGDKVVPSARAMQKMANAQKISSEVLRIEWYDRESFYTAACTVYVRAWIGPRAKPKQESTQSVTLSMVGIIQRYATKKMSGGVDEWRGKGAEPDWFKRKKADAWKETDVSIDAGGRIMPTGKKNQLDMLSYLSDQFMFLDRMAITKAESRAFDKMLRPDAIADDEDDLDGLSVDPDTGEVTEPPLPHPPARKVAKKAKAEVVEPADAPTPEEPYNPDFPPSDEELAQHEKNVAEIFSAPAPVKDESPKKKELSPLSAAARKLTDEIDAAGPYRSKLESLGSTLTKAKGDLSPEEHGRVMQHFWAAINASK